MELRVPFAVFSDYNAWMNLRLLDACAQLDAAALREDRGAWFGSILGTLNHILVADIIWLQRFAAHPRGFETLAPVVARPRPSRLDEILFDGLVEYRVNRAEVDQCIRELTGELEEADLDHPLEYANMAGERHCKPFGLLLLHFFNHQTHHRGQVTTLLSQLGIDPGVTDLLVRIPGETPPP